MKTVFSASASVSSPTFMDSSAWLLNKHWVWAVETAAISQLIFFFLSVALLVVYIESNLEGASPGAISGDTVIQWWGEDNVTGSACYTKVERKRPVLIKAAEPVSWHDVTCEPLVLGFHFCVCTDSPKLEELPCTLSISVVSVAMFHLWFMILFESSLFFLDKSS